MEEMQQVVSEDYTKCDADDAVAQDEEEPANDGRNYAVENGWLLKLWARKKIRLANFHLTIDSQKLKRDEGHVRGRMLDLTVHRAGNDHPLTLSVEEFLSARLKRKILEVAGSEAILYGSLKDLRIATQELSGICIPETSVSTSVGFTADGCYLSRNMLITPDGIIANPAVEVDLSEGNFSSKIGFLHPDDSILPQLGRHLLEDFLNLKSHDVMYILMGHIVLALFSSDIKDLSGKGKPALHVQGPSGSGKTFECTLAMNFFGEFDDRFASWSSTANAIEMEGWYFRDSLYFVDDYKARVTDQQTLIRILQNHADAHGRARLRSNARMSDQRYIRGLLLSTGEDFISDVESITGRTILLRVEPEKNLQAGARCWQNRSLYRMFLPGLIQMVLSNRNWREIMRQFVDEKISLLDGETRGLSNGLRIASNWALNWLGFNLFLDYLSGLGVIDELRKAEMTDEYEAIVRKHLQAQALEMQSQNSVSIMFRVLGQKLAVGTVSISGLNGSSDRGKLVGVAKESGRLIQIYPDILLEALTGHFKAVGQRTPFTKSALRDALAQEGLIGKASNGRWTRQVRGTDGRRFNVWEFEAGSFLARCGDA